MDAQNPTENIEVRPNDVISVPKGQLVYVIGAVKRSGGFVLGENERISALEVLALTEGFDRFADKKQSKIMRTVGTTGERTEIPIDLKAILEGKSPDLKLQAQDILFVPISGKKAATVRGLETALGVGSSVTTGLIIYRR